MFGTYGTLGIVARSPATRCWSGRRRTLRPTTATDHGEVGEYAQWAVFAATRGFIAGEPMCATLLRTV